MKVPTPTTPFQRLTSSVILVVDDDATNRLVLQRRLEHQGAGVVTASNAPEALELIEGDSARSFDAVLLDYMMPGMDGLETLCRIREERSAIELPVIMQTALSESAVIIECLRAGANDYITKPIDLPVLLARLETHLKVRQLSAEKDSFLAMASHDLKSPLATVRGFTFLLEEMLPEGAVMTARARDMLARIQRQSRTMERMVCDFLDMDAIENGQMRLERSPVDLANLVAEAVEANREQAAAKGIELRISLPPSLPPTIHVDETRIQQVVTNLISNGVKFCRQDDIVEARVSSNARSATIEVADTGPGIPAVEMGRVFEKYAKLSTKPTGGEKSSGLGLCIARWLVELHGGRIIVVNNAAGEGPDGLGRGARFIITLPIQQSPEQA